MKAIACALTALMLGVGIAACGSSNSSTTSSAPSSQTTTHAVAQGKAQGARLMSDLGGVVSQMATSTGKLASGNSSSEQAARTNLARLQRKASGLAARANQQLPAGSPAQTLVSQISTQVSTDASKLRGKKVTPSDRQTLRSAQVTLNGLSGQINKAARNLKAASAPTIAQDVERLAHELTA